MVLLLFKEHCRLTSPLCDFGCHLFLHVPICSLSGQDGIAETGVSLAYTVRELDSGPVIAYERVVVDDIIKVLYSLKCVI